MIFRRADELRKRLQDLGLDAFLVTDLLNVRYLTGFTGSSAVLLVHADDAHILTDFRYAEQVAQECPGLTPVISQEPWMKQATDILKCSTAERVGFEGHSLTYHGWSEINSAGIPMVETEGLVAGIRIIKDEDEIAAICEAARITDAACEHILTFLKPGMSEREVALEIDCYMRRNGAEKEGFDTIAASGPRGALPHAKPSERRIAPGELVVLDFGARWQGYHADITRTALIGKPDEKQQEVYETVLEAQRRAIAAIRPGVTGGEIDAVARDYISGKGYGEYFGHSLGHGLGLAVHDDRTLVADGRTVLKPGMITTVEPGVYLPGWGGVRIEDDVLVTEGGAELLTRCPRDLRIKGG